MFEKRSMGDMHNVVHTAAMSPKTRFQILLEPEQLDASRTIQTRTGAGVAAQIRCAMENWIAEHAEKKKPARGRASSSRRKP
jgi:hypothetical protein